MLKEQYSGEESRKFWKLVNKYDDKKMTLYSLGCALQNLEGEVLKLLKERMKKSK